MAGSAKPDVDRILFRGLEVLHIGDQAVLFRTRETEKVMKQLSNLPAFSNITETRALEAMRLGAELHAEFGGKAEEELKRLERVSCQQVSAGRIKTAAAKLSPRLGCTWAQRIHDLIPLEGGVMAAQELVLAIAAGYSAVAMGLELPEQEA